MTRAPATSRYISIYLSIYLSIYIYLVELVYAEEVHHDEGACYQPLSIYLSIYQYLPCRTRLCRGGTSWRGPLPPASPRSWLWRKTVSRWRMLKIENINSYNVYFIKLSIPEKSRWKDWQIVVWILSIFMIHLLRATISKLSLLSFLYIFIH